MKKQIDRRHSNDDQWTYIDDVELNVEHLAQKQGMVEEKLDLLATRCADCRHQQIRARSQWAACLAWVSALAFVAFVVAFSA